MGELGGEREEYRGQGERRVDGRVGGGGRGRNTGGRERGG